MRAVVTGAAGFVGRHLVRFLRERGDEVVGVVHPDDGRGRAEPLPLGAEARAADILDADRLAEVLRAARPDVVFHLAAFSNPEGSWAASRRALETNILGAHNVLEAALAAGGPKVLLVGSCQQYGLVAEAEQPIAEETPQRPLTPYGVSKAAQELLGLRFFLAASLPVYLVRPFNHTGPGQASSYVCSSFARQIVAIERGERPPRLEVGNLAARRDFSDVRDVVRAYVAVVERGEPAVAYNVCRGVAVSIREIVDTLVALAGASIDVVVDEARLHAADVPLLVGSRRRIGEAVGWAPRIPLETTLADLLAAWRAAPG